MPTYSFHQAEVLLPHEEGGRKAGDLLPSTKDHVGEFRGGPPSFQSDLLVSHHVDPSSTLGRGHSDRERGSDHHPTSTQTDGGSDYHPPPNFYRMPLDPELNWNMGLSRRHRSCLKSMNISKPNRPGGMKGSGHR